MRFRIVVIGASLGGLSALESLLEVLPPSFRLPLAIVQHRGDAGGDHLRQALQRHCALRVREPQDKEPIREGYVYLAPAGYHLLVDDGFFSLSTEGAVSYARPSIDVLFESAADSYGPGVIALVLTGANRDGAAGSATIKAQGGCVIVQNPESAECPVLPRAVMAATSVDRVLDLPEMAACLIELDADVDI